MTIARERLCPGGGTFHDYRLMRPAFSDSSFAQIASLPRYRLMKRAAMKQPAIKRPAMKRPAKGGSDKVQAKRAGRCIHSLR